MTTMDSGRLRRLCLGLALAGFFPLAVTAATHDPASDVPARFDAAVAAGFPAVISTGGRGSAQAMIATPASDELVVRRRVESRSTYSDGSPVELYDVQFRGHDAVALRHGANLSITSIDDHLLRSTTFTAGGAHPAEDALPVEGRLPQGTIDEEPGYDSDEDLADDLADDKESQELHVFAFIHDDVPLNDDEIFARFFGWWIKRMEFDVLEDRRTHVHLLRDIPGITQPSYGHKGALSQWIDMASEYVEPDVAPPMTIVRSRRILLVNGRTVEPGAAGIANAQPGSYAMASTVGSIAVPAHEIGHMLNASHDHAERRFTGPFSTCDTIMYPVDPTVLCKAYSLPNVDRIRRLMDYRRPR